MSQVGTDPSSRALVSRPRRIRLRASLDRLPRDLISLIFRCLNKQSPSYFNHALVCKRWNRLAYLAQTSIANSPPRLTADAALLASLSRFRHLTSLKIDECVLDEDNGVFLYELGSWCPRLTHLDLGNGYREALTYEAADSLFTGCTSLQYLLLTMKTADFCGLPSSFFNLSSLTEVNLNVDFDEIPDKFDQLRFLTKLTLNDVCSDHLPESLGYLTSLTELQLSTSETFDRLPDSIGCLKSLVKLSIHNLDVLGTLPATISQLQNLQEFYANDINCLKLPDSFFQLRSLQVLDLLYCGDIGSLPSAVSSLVSLKTLSIRSCTLSSISESLCTLSNLRVLVLRNCTMLRDLPRSMDRMTSLEHLELCQLSSLTHLPSTISKLSNLRSFSFRYCDNIDMVPPSLTQHWSSLTSLEFSWPDSCLEDSKGEDEFMSSVRQLSNLSTLLLVGFVGLNSLPVGIEKLSQLRRLTLSSWPDLERLPKDMSGFTCLTNLVITGCPLFVDDDEGDPISTIPNLESGCVDGRVLGKRPFGGKG
ncbi:unnamed protein product [Closterium sp. Yama58-4]|nr:unnamed protein product [Closterium sp. Yama58-4]